MSIVERKLIDPVKITSFDCSNVKRNTKKYKCEVVDVDTVLKWENKDLGDYEARGTSPYPLFNLVGQHVPVTMRKDYYYGRIWKNIWDTPTSLNGGEENMCVTMNGLIAAWHLAFVEHYPVRMSPDDVWTVIVHQIALHISENPEKYRDIFVQHDGKKEIELKYSPSEYVPGKADNDWSRVIGDFCGKIKEDIGDELFSVIVSDFSTTTPLQKFISCVGLMNANQHYFNYTINTLCGVPEVQLEGDIGDWIKLRDKSLKLISRFSDLGKWLERLIPTLDKFIETVDSKKETDIKWWESFYHYENASGGPEVTGHIANLFTYIKDKHGSSLRISKEVPIGSWNGYSPMSFPTTVSKVPIKWKISPDETFNLTLMAGSLGCTQDPNSLAISPHLMWSLYRTV